MSGVTSTSLNGGVTSRPRASSWSAASGATPTSTLVVPLRPRQKPRPSPKKQPAAPKVELSIPTDDQVGESDISSLSSTRPSPSQENPPQASSVSCTVRPAFSQPLPSASTSILPSQPISLGRREEAWSLAGLGTYVWVLIEEKGGKGKGPCIFELEDGEDEERDLIWWPGKIKGSGKVLPLKVELFGIERHPDVEICTPAQRNIRSKLDRYDRTRFQSFEEATYLPSSPSETSLLLSPRKRRKLDNNAGEQKRDRVGAGERWLNAVQAMLFEEQEEAGSDHLPEVGEAFSFAHVYTKFSPSKNSKGKGKRQYMPSVSEEGGEDLSTGDQWSPPPVDYDLEIPGELVLAKDGPNTSLYWPAKVLEYIVPKMRKEKEGKYKVVYLDSTEQNIPRRWFWSSDQDEFATCKLGKFQSAHDDDVNDSDSDSETVPVPPLSPSPLPSSPAPSPSDFADLPIRHQFVYTKPILQAILSESYPPAKDKHFAFIAGGKARHSVAEGAGQRGKMDPKEVMQLQVVVSAWCLRDGVRANTMREEEDESEEQPYAKPVEMVGKAGKDSPPEGERSGSPTGTEIFLSPRELPPDSSFSPTDVPMKRNSSPEPKLSLLTVNSTATECISVFDDDSLSDLTNLESSPCPASILLPQQGCEAYEALSGVEKVDYCLNVLLPETILQILLWRSGDRTSPGLLPPDEEQALHDKGEALMRETDWVFDVMRLRGLKAKQLKKKEEKERKQMINARWGGGSKKARPKRNGRVPDYRE